MTETWRGRIRRCWRSVRKEAADSVTEPDAHDEVEVAAAELRHGEPSDTDVNTSGTTVAAVFSIALGTLARFSVFHTFSTKP